jgi:hypothetical protein
LQDISPVDEERLKEGLTHYQWTIDREREIWFTVKEREKSGLTSDRREREYYTGNDIYVLSYKGAYIEITIRRMFEEEKAKKKISNNYRVYIIWELIRIKKPEVLKNTSYEEIIDILKEVLSVNGEEGIYRNLSKEDVSIEFKF